MLEIAKIKKMGIIRTVVAVAYLSLVQMES